MDTDEIVRLDARIKALQERKAKVLQNTLMRDWNRLVARFRSAGVPLPTEAGAPQRPRKYRSHAYYAQLFEGYKLPEWQLNVGDFVADHVELRDTNTRSAFCRYLRSLGWTCQRKNHWKRG